MRRIVSIVASLVALAVFVSAAPAAGKSVPLKGSSSQQAVSAVPTEDPNVVFVTTVGEGHMTHLGRFTFVSPHASGLTDFSIEGTQNFTAANGDELYADISGQLQPVVEPDGHVFLVGTVTGTITGGTGRFENATGTYQFHIVFDTATAASTGEFDGDIVFAGD